METAIHTTRAHSKFSPSGMERIVACPGSVNLSEGLPSRDTSYSKEGTQAHEVLELLLLNRIEGDNKILHVKTPVTAEMIARGTAVADWLYNLHQQIRGSELLVETKIGLPFIHQEMFGSFDSAIVDHFGTLHVFDYKYGKHSVSPTRNLQMIAYGMGLAHQFNWNFKRVRLYIIQPRVPRYEGATFWDISIKELQSYVPVFRKAIQRTIDEPDTFVEGPHCFFCKAKGVCPKKLADKLENARMVFKQTPLSETTKQTKGKTENGKSCKTGK